MYKTYSGHNFYRDEINARRDSRRWIYVYFHDVDVPAPYDVPYTVYRQVLRDPTFCNPWTDLGVCFLGETTDVVVSLEPKSINRFGRVLIPPEKKINN